MEKLCRKQIDLLQQDTKGSVRFHELEKQLRNDRRNAGVSLDMEKRTVLFDLVLFLRGGMISEADLECFSKELVQRVRDIMEQDDEEGTSAASKADVLFRQDTAFGKRAPRQTFHSLLRTERIVCCNIKRIKNLGRMMRKVTEGVTEMLNIIREKKGNDLTLKLQGRLDTITAPQLEAVLREEAEKMNTLTVDLAELEYISSAGLRVLIAAVKMMNKLGGMKVVNVSEAVMDVLDITGFKNFLNIR